MADWYRRDGAPLPLGATWTPEERACNFALYARHAEAVTLLLYEPGDLTVAHELPLAYQRHKSGRVWHARLSDADLGQARYYAYRVDGPYAPAEGHRFDPEKVLLDPYARHVFLPPGFDRQGSTGPGSNAGRAPLGEIPREEEPPFDWGNDPRPRHGHDAVVYEMHVRGFTRRPNSGVAEESRGTFAGVVEKIPYLQELGVTVVELMPVFLFDPEPGPNYWGYMPLSFFAPHEAYSGAVDGAGRAREFKAMVRALHEAGIEVVLDVVFNHTSEGDERGPTYCYRGIDNSTYYLLGPGGAYRNDTGTGNTLRTAHPFVRRMIVDSLRHWVREMHVDGFRFDLASIFTRDDDGVITTEEPPIISEITGDPDFADVRLIAEPWDLGAYHLGRAFPGVTWAQWNGRYRDQVRDFVKGTGRVGDMMARLYGSTDLFGDTLAEAYRPQQSINFVTCHDGFCLYDLVAYAQKHNEANGHGNTDGTDDNHSWNWGVEGDEGATPGILALRRRLMKMFCALLMLSNGTPMFLAGDELANTQGGNNNPYNQDNETTWLDWDRLQSNQELFRFFRLMIAFRRAHPSIGRGRFWGPDVRWYGVDGAADLADWSRAFAFHLDGAAEGDDDLYVMINAWWEDLTFRVQEGGPGAWARVVDTAEASPGDFLEAGAEEAAVGGTYTVAARSVVVLTRARSG